MKRLPHSHTTANCLRMLDEFLQLFLCQTCRKFSTCRQPSQNILLLLGQYVAHCILYNAQRENVFTWFRILQKFSIAGRCKLSLIEQIYPFEDEMRSDNRLRCLLLSKALRTLNQLIFSVLFWRKVLYKTVSNLPAFSVLPNYIFVRNAFFSNFVHHISFNSPKVRFSTV